MTPFSQYKGWLAEGGIRNALIVSGPVVNRPRGSIHRTIMHVADIMPTLLDVAGVAYPEMLDGRPLPPLIGESWTRLLSGEADAVRSDKDYLAWEVFGNRALRQGNWKLRWQWKPFGNEEWELFDLSEDPSERNDQAAAQPEILEAMVELWEDYVAANNVILPSRSPNEDLDNQMPARYPDDAGYPPILYQRQFIPPPDMMRESQ